MDIRSPERFHSLSNRLRRLFSSCSPIIFSRADEVALVKRKCYTIEANYFADYPRCCEDFVVCRGDDGFDEDILSTKEELFKQSMAGNVKHFGGEGDIDSIDTPEEVEAELTFSGDERNGANLKTSGGEDAGEKSKNNDTEKATKHPMIFYEKKLERKRESKREAKSQYATNQRQFHNVASNR